MYARHQAAKWLKEGHDVRRPGGVAICEEDGEIESVEETWDFAFNMEDLLADDWELAD